MCPEAKCGQTQVLSLWGECLLKHHRGPATFLKYLLKSQDGFISLFTDEKKKKKKTRQVTTKKGAWKGQNGESIQCVCWVEGEVAAAGDCGLGSAAWLIGAESADSFSALCSFFYGWLME